MLVACADDNAAIVGTGTTVCGCFLSNNISKLLIYSYDL